ncbi:MULTISPECIES: hypothetical protein [Methylomonas]|uniref:Uncharacterized protein n=1 Tax=Methylomonas koyamae TaxID=702114 RepID=A0A177N2F0_9GAMM|nr:hypothetical protein [Methylomonas koyamae]OAI12031.1 hypothetical protein A1355_01020 [Methylomonas koyamae]
MAEDRKPESGGYGSPLPIALIMTMLASLLIGHSLPYQDERPSADPLKSSHPSLQNIDARLWQDPFSTVENAANAAGKSLADAKSFALFVDGRPANVEIRPSPTAPPLPEKKAIVPDGLKHSNQAITVMAVTLPGGPYPEEAEQRMRRRYAVLSGLANQDWIPSDEQHIGAFEPDQDDLQRKVPFEWWLPRDGNEKSPILVLWLDEASLTETPFAKINHLLKLAVPEHDQVSYRVIGPNSSATLRTMLAEIENPSFVHTLCPTSPKLGDAADCRLDIGFYAAAATAADFELSGLCKNKDAHCLEKLFSDKGIRLLRTTSSDDELMKALVSELSLRRISANAHIVILSEWDTFYGRAMRDTFVKTWPSKPKTTPPGSQCGQKTVHSYSYMRGLDGKLPKSGDKSADAKGPGSGKDKPAENANIETPEGQSQKDYLRRLAGNIAELDACLIQSSPDGGIAAIGILGSDVYDKLMILQALRQYFPHTLFFTTDLDAIYNHPSKWLQTHNLLVAAPYGLYLDDQWQGSIPPFRDNYQTALFLSTQLAVTPPPLNIKPIIPTLFEIGRSRPIPLAVPRCDDSRGLSPNPEHCMWPNWEQTDQGIQPAVKSSRFSFEFKNLLFLSLSLICMACLVSWQIRKWALSAVCRVLDSGLTACIATAVALSALGIFVVFNEYLASPMAEPFYWLEGASIWPTEGLRLVSYLVAVAFFCWGQRRLAQMRVTVSETFGLPNHADASIKECKLMFVGSWEVTENPTQPGGRDTLRRLLTQRVPPFSDWLVKDLLLIATLAWLIYYYSQTCVPQTPMALPLQTKLYLGLSILSFVGLTLLVMNSACAIGIRLGADAIQRKLATPAAATARLWQHYLGYLDNTKLGIPGNLLRVLIHSLAFIVVAGITMRFGQLPNIPARGTSVVAVNAALLLLSVLSTVMLTMWVVEHARLCERLIGNLTQQSDGWNRRAIEHAQANAVAESCVSEWLKIQLVKELTKAMQPLIWGPVAVIGLMVLARNPAIDDWNLPWGLRAVFILMFIYAFSAEWLLQRGARTTRRRAIEQWSFKVRELRHSGNATSAEIDRIESEIESARALREGAFRPWYEWPLLQAFGGTGALLVLFQQLSEYWTLSQY